MHGCICQVLIVGKADLVGWAGMASGNQSQCLPPVLAAGHEAPITMKRKETMTPFKALYTEA